MLLENAAGDALDAPGTGHAGVVSPALDELKARRAELRAEYHKLDAGRARLLSASERQKAATEALAAIGEAESAEMAEWAMAGALGALPQPKAQEREEAAKEIAAALQSASICSRRKETEKTH